MTSIKSSVAACCIAALLPIAPVAAATLTVNSLADDGNGTCTAAKCTLRDAILGTSAGDTVGFSLPASSTITLTNGQLLIDKNMTISGPGPGALSVRRSSAAGTPSFRIFNIAASATATLSGLTIANGLVAVVGGSGGGILNNGVLTIVNCTISGNALTDGGSSGGGISNFGNKSLTIIDSTISDNSTTASGGGIFSAVGTLTITNTTLSGNSAGSGGALLNTSGGIVNIGNATISGNTAGDGAGTYHTNGTVTFTNTTISGNTASGNGGGIARNLATVNVRNTIIALNTAPNGPDILGLVTSQGYNLIGNNKDATITTAPGAIGDQIGTAVTPKDPLLGPLQNNGGLTRSQAPLPGSPAIDKGDSSGASTDQRGFVRPVDTPSIVNAGDGSDIGAYEVQPDQLIGCSESNLVVNNNNDGGAGSLRAVIASACGGSAITFSANVRGTITLSSGELAIGKNLVITGPGANLLSVQRSAAAGTPSFRIFTIAPATVKATIAGMTVANGSSGPGGGISNVGTLALLHAAVSGNAGNAGGGIFNSGTLTITRSTISGNTVSNNIIAGSGGGIFNSGGTLTITSSTISGNTAMGPGGNSDSGGGILTNVGTVTITNSTISGNSADLGGGIRNVNGGTVNARNSIIALNTSASGPDVSGPLQSQGLVLVGTVDGNGSVTPLFADQIGVTAAQLNLGPLQDNGGPTRTHALLSGSVAINKGHSSGAVTDQRGFARPVGTGLVPGSDGGDVGAFELGGGNIDIDGNRGYDALTDGLLIIRYLFGLTGSTVTNGAIGVAPVRSTPTEIIQYLDSIKPVLDVDGNGQADALTDGLLIIRYLFGLRGPALTAGAIGAGSMRTPTQIETYIQSLIP